MKNFEIKIEPLNLNNVIITFANKEYFADLLGRIAHRYELDMLVVYKQIIDNDDDGITTRTILMDEVSGAGITLSELDRIAKDNTARLFPAVVNDFCGMKIITNSTSNLGASVILYSDIVKQTAETMKSDIYLIPSSIHEFIAIPTEGLDVCELTETIRSVNGNVVTGKEILSDHPYIYIRKHGILKAI